MTDSSVNTAARLSVAVALAASTVLGCAARPSPPPAQPAASASVVPSRMAPPPPEPPATQSAGVTSTGSSNADGVVSLIAKPSLWPLDVGSARRVLQMLGPVALEQRTSDDLSLVGGPIGALERFDVRYALHRDKYWVFGSAGFFLNDPDLERLHEGLERRLVALLGRPRWMRQDEGAIAPTSTWDLGEGILLSLGPCPGGRPCMAVVAASDPAYVFTDHESLTASSHPAD